MPELQPAGFMSYARNDDEHDGGYLTEFRRALEGELRAQTGDQIKIFQDREGILWGQVWRDRLDSGVDAATILLPIITPSFFKSAACRKELERFLNRETELGRTDLIFPLYYIRSPLIDDPDRRKGDDLAEIIASRQYRDWTENRFEALDSRHVRKDIADLAGEIVAALERGVTFPSEVEIVEDDPWPDADPGFIERVAALELAFPALTANLETFQVLLERVREVTAVATEDMDRANREGAPAGAKLAAVQRYRSQLEPIVDEFDSITREYADLMAQADVGAGALIAASYEQTEPTEKAAAAEFLNMMIALPDGAGEALDSIEEFAQIVEGLLPMSSTTRPVFKSLIHSVRRVVESRPVFLAWKAQATAALANIADKGEGLGDNAASSP